MTYAGTIADYSQMGHPPWSLSLVSESITTGRFADGEPAIVADGPVQCVRIRYHCPASGCTVPTFDQGVLATTEKHTYYAPR
jgi:hypothetical protein